MSEIRTTLGAIVRVFAASPYLGKGSILRFSMLDDDRSAEVYLTPEEKDAVGQMLGCYTRQQVGEYQAREATLIAEPLRRQVEDLQRQLAEATGQAEAAKQATREIMAERNTWARQLADMRDERETAREEASTQRDRYISTSVDRDNLVVEIERQIESWEQHPDRSGNDLNLSAVTTEIRVKELRRALAQWINI